ncbi:MAG: hypothetical protein IJK90_09185 [Bacteroidales bacterium]|nr:hypothetical protein [Bacteroidales bacterium]
MSCFLVPLAEAVVVSAIRKSNDQKIRSEKARPLMRHLPTLEKMLWGGSLMLVVDHAVNGELTAFSWGDILTVGVPMAAVLTVVWAGYSLFVGHRRKVKTATINN